MKLKVIHGSLSRTDGRTVLSDIDFSFSGEGIMSIVGPNGAGKTTLLKSILGFLDWTEGVSVFDGIPRKSWSSRQFWSKAAYVPQAKSLRFSALTVAELVVLGRGAGIGLFGKPGKKDWDAVDRALDETGISSLSGRLCSEISGGELQLALIARALAGDPELLFLDEPETNLDFKNRLTVINAVRRFAARGRGAVVVTHFPEYALDYSEHALLLDENGRSAFGDTVKMFTEENLSLLYGVDMKVRRRVFPDSFCSTVTAVGRKNS